MRIQIGTRTITVQGKNIRRAVTSHLFENWVAKLDKSFTIHSVLIQSVDVVTRGGQEEILFLKLKADVTDERGRSRPGIVFLRGSSVAILPILETRCGDYALLINGGSVAIGGFTYLQLPAGMTDGSSDFLGVAMRELEEETGLNPNHGTFFDLSQMYFKEHANGIYPSPGACDELIYLFVYRQKMSIEELRRLEEQETGLAQEHEHLTMTAIPLDEVCRQSRDMKVHVAYHMYDTLRKEGKL